MNTTTTDERIAILLQSLGKDVAENVLEQLATERVAAVRSRLTELEEEPPAAEEIDEVLDEFHRFLRFVLESGGTDQDEEETAAGAETEQTASTIHFEPSGDPFADLARLHSFQIAGALRDERPAAVAVILGCLPAERVGEVIQQLPEDVRKEVFLRIGSSPPTSRALLARMVQATVDKGCVLNRDAVSDPEDVADDKLAQMLRSMDRGNRQEMLLALEESDEEAAARIKNLLYMFEDLLNVTDRSIQKLLAEVDASTLAVALKNAEEDLVGKVTNNLSKRARATLLEEIEYLGMVTTDKQDEAEKAVCEVLARLDEAGDLEMME